MFNPKPYCHYCKRDSILLVSLHAPGIYYICDDCIKKQEARDNTVAVLFYSSGLKFVSHEEVARLGLESAQPSVQSDVVLRAQPQDDAQKVGDGLTAGNAG